MKRYKKVLILAACVLGALLLVCMERGIVGSLSTQQLAKRWSEENEFAQVACYFSRDNSLDAAQIVAVQRSLAASLEEAALGSTNENGGRNWIDAYASQGECYISSNRSGMKVRVFGVGGDFFQFHPLTLMDGNYFDATDENADGIILDEVVAWQLFGSNNVAGMEIEINNAIYPIRGVIRSDNGMFSEAVEEEAATIYVSFEILEKLYSGKVGIDCYEVLIANPVKGFGKEAVAKAIDMDEKEYELVEVSARFDFLHRVDILKNFGIRSMNTRNIVFPYWENRAKGYEDVSALFLVLEAICLIYPIVWLVRRCYKLWKQRKAIKNRFFEICRNFCGNIVPVLKKTVKTYKLVNKKKQKEEA